MSEELPRGWVSVGLKELFDFKYGKALPQEKRNSSGSVSVYGSNGVVGVHGSAVTKGPTIIVGRKGSVGEVHFSSSRCWPIDTTYFIDEFPSGLPPTLWALYLKSLRLGQQDKSSAIPGISRDDIYSMEAPLPPLAEQRRIVAKLETLVGKVDSCQQRLAKIPTILKRFRQSVLAAACSGRLTVGWREDAAPADLIPPEPANPIRAAVVEDPFDAAQAWRQFPLDALCDPNRSVCYGVIKLGSEATEGVPCLRTSDVKPLSIETAGVKRIARAISDEYRRTLLRGGEVLVNVRGTLGGVAAVPVSLRGWNVSREVAVVPVKGVVPKFLAFWIASRPCQDWLTGVAKGVAYTGINIADLKRLPVALPSLPEQHEIVRRVEALFAFADKIEARFATAQAQVDRLTASLLAKAFRGELVPQDPNDEPASALLERIRAERSAANDAAPANRKPRGRRRRLGHLQSG